MGNRMYADSLKMASWQPIPRFSPGDLVTYRGETTCLVSSINNQLGFNRFKLLDLDRGYEIIASSHEMVLFEPENKLSVNIDIPALDTAREPAPKRFKTKSDSEVDELAKRRTETSTDRQTEWAVRIFRGQF